MRAPCDHAGTFRPLRAPHVHVRRHTPMRARLADSRRPHPWWTPFAQPGARCHAGHAPALASAPVHGGRYACVRSAIRPWRPAFVHASALRPRGHIRPCQAPPPRGAHLRPCKRMPREQHIFATIISKMNRMIPVVVQCEIGGRVAHRYTSCLFHLDLPCPRPLRRQPRLFQVCIAPSAVSICNCGQIATSGARFDGCSQMLVGRPPCPAGTSCF